MPLEKRTVMRVVLAMFLGLVASTNSSSAETVLIMNPDLAGEALSNNDLLRVYAMKKRTWSNGEPVVVFTLPNKSAEHRDFVYSYLKMQPHHLSRLWHKLVFSGTGTKPEVVADSQEMLEKVASTPGAIGYLDDEQVNFAGLGVIKVTTHE